MIEIALNLQMSLERTDILMFSLLIHEHGLSLHLFIYFFLSLVFCRFLLVDPIHIVRLIPKCFIFCGALLNVLNFLIKKIKFLTAYYWYI